jgi:regulatory protein
LLEVISQPFQDEYKLGAAKLQKLLTARDRPASDLRDHLLKSGFQPDVVDLVLQRARECGLVDDARYAERFCKRKLQAGWGRNRIINALQQQGIDPSVSVSLEGMCDSEDDEVERALQALSRFTPHSKNEYQARLRHLVGKGFAPNIASTALRQYASEEECGQEYL